MDKRIKERQRERERRNANFCAENFLGFGKFSLSFSKSVDFQEYLKKENPRK
jgi:hypothetical protein